MRRLTLSVVTPNYNHGHLIGRAIEAVISQSRPPDEYIIIDDASTDNSLEIIQGYAGRYPYIKVIRNQRNLGVFATALRFTSLATGDFIYAGAADDYVLPGFFERAMEMAQRYPEAGIIFGKQVTLDTKGKELVVGEATRWPRPLLAAPDTYVKEFLNVESPGRSLTTATVFKRTALQEVNSFKRHLMSWGDTFSARAIALKYGAAYVPERFAVRTVQPNSFSNRVGNNPRMMLDLIARAAWLMRSPEFRARFPEEHVSWWERKYRQLIVNAQPWFCRIALSRYQGDLSCFEESSR